MRDPLIEKKHLKMEKRGGASWGGEEREVLRWCYGVQSRVQEKGVKQRLRNMGLELRNVHRETETAVGTIHRPGAQRRLKRKKYWDTSGLKCGPKA